MTNKELCIVLFDAQEKINSRGTENPETERVNLVLAQEIQRLTMLDQPNDTKRRLDGSYARCK
jgi:hypothetical protein